MKKRLVVLMSVFLTVSAITVAQEFDDIYFNSSKKKETKKDTDKKQGQKVNHADYYNVNSNAVFEEIENNRDVDEYNRRFVNRDTLKIDSAMINECAEFAYTERIQRFHNPSVIDEANDAEIIQLYNNSKPTVNVIVSPNSWSPYWAWGIGYSTWGYGWNSPVYSPWYYDWSWGWSGWGWHRNHYYHGWFGPSYHGPVFGGGINQVVNHRPSNMGGGGRRPFGTSYRSEGGNRRSGTSINKGSHSTASVRPAGRRPSVGRSTGTTVYRGSNSSSGYRRSSTSRSTSYSTPPAASSSFSRSSSSSSNSGSRGGGGNYGGGGGGGSRSSGSSGGRR